MDEIFLEVNDYLDLYLLAGSLKDVSWQEEMLEKLRNYHPSEYMQRKISFTIQNLRKEYRMTNIEILDLYHELRTHSGHEENLHEKISQLEIKRRVISKKIHVEESKLQDLILK